MQSADSIIVAISREKQLKNWKREWKNELINSENPEWKDLSEEIGVDSELIKAVKEHYREIAGQAYNATPTRHSDERQNPLDE